MNLVWVIGYLWIICWTTYTYKTTEKCNCNKTQILPCRVHKSTVDCSNLGLNQMPTCQQLEIKLSDISSFNLSHNHIADIASSYFECFTHLEILIMDSNPLVVIQNITFNGLGKLKHLFIRCTIRRDYELIIFEKGAFSHFKDLEYLNIEGTMVIARNFFKMTLCELPPTIHTLILRKINFFRQRLYLTQEMTTCLWKLQLQTLVLDHNFIGVVTTSGFLQLRNVQNLSLRNNELLDTSLSTIFEIGGAFKCLNYFDIGCQSSIDKACGGPTSFLQNRIMTNKKRNKICKDIKFATQDKTAKFALSNITVYTLPNLEVLKVDHIHSNFGDFGSENVKVCWKNNNLKYFDFSGNRVRNVYATLLCMDKLRNLNLENIHAHVMDYTVLHAMPALEILNLGGALPASDLSNENASLLFSKSKNLTTLVLSDIGLKSLNHSVIEPAVSLERMILSRNKFKTIDKKMFKNMSNLRFIDLSYNLLSDIPLYVIKHLENVLKANPKDNATLDITGNPLFCTCRSLDVMKNVLNTTNVEIVSYRNKTLMCMLANGTRVSMLDALTQLNTQCQTGNAKTAILLESVLYPLVLIGTATLALLYRKRWYFKYTLYFYMNRNNVCDLSDKENYIFDAFLSHSYQDEKWVIENLLNVLENGQNPYTLCVHYRNFLAGQFIPDNIIQAVKSSRKTVLVVTKNFIKSRWCDFELRAAQEHHLSRDMRGIIAIVLPGMEARLKRGGSILTAMMDAITYIKWPLEEEGKNLFFLQLRRALGDPLEQDNMGDFQVLPF